MAVYDSNRKHNEIYIDLYTIFSLLLGVFSEHNYYSCLLYTSSTTDGQPGWGGWYFSVFSSDNLKDWKDEGVMLDLKSDQVAWADGNAWAPCIEEKMVDGKYYKYFFLSLIHI